MSMSSRSLNSQFPPHVGRSSNSYTMSKVYDMDSDEEIATAAAAYVLFGGEFLKRKSKRILEPVVGPKPAPVKSVKRKKRRWWMTSCNKRRKRDNENDVLTELLKEPSAILENFCRMSATDFEYLLRKIGFHIAKQDTNMRKSVSIQQRLAVTLRYFATGDTYASLANKFEFSTQTVSRSVSDVCKALIQELHEEVKLPKNDYEWLNIARGYETDWNFPNCLGAIDGKEIMVQHPRGTFSLLLLALVDVHYCFTFVEIECQDQKNDGVVLNNSSFFSKQRWDQLNIPPDGQLPSSEKTLPYVFLGDSAFALSRHMMTPYPGTLEKESAKRIFNCRLSRARRVVENVLGVMTSVFRVFRKPFMLDSDKVSNVILACVMLHNFMRRSASSSSTYTPPDTFDAEIDGEIIPGSWRNHQSEMTSFKPMKKAARNSGGEAKDIRKSFAEYFTTSGNLPWLNKYC